MKRIVKRSAGVVATSPAFLRWALKGVRKPDPKRDRVFYLGFDSGFDSLSRPASDADTVQILFIGSFGKSYDLEVAIEAFNLLAQSKDNRDRIRLVIAGDGEKREKLSALANGNSMIQFTGWLGPEELQKLKNQSDLGLACYSRDAMQSFPNKVFEYMEAGLPIIHCLKGEFREFVSEEKIGFEYSVGDARSLAELLSHVCDNLSVLEETRRRVKRVFLREFQMKDIYKNFREYLEEMNQ